ncbi:MAG: type II toxin-antitoxin system VapC family toxin [Thiotrichaceae bacterium]
MRILIDTHIFLWAISEPHKLSKTQRTELETLSNIIYVSSITIVEIMIKTSLGKLNVDFDPLEIAEKSGFELLDFSALDGMALKDMPFHHKDPFDRMLIAQSINNKFHIMSDDSKFKHYDCKLIK